tara:strand:- start:213 stop:395 length:183 start_codon:yes stop_codon:yes gene_type:complete
MYNNIMKTRNKNYDLFIEKQEPDKPKEKPSVERKREKEPPNKKKKNKKLLDKIISSYILI